MRVTDDGRERRAQQPWRHGAEARHFPAPLPATAILLPSVWLGDRRQPESGPPGWSTSSLLMGCRGRERLGGWESCECLLSGRRGQAPPRSSSLGCPEITSHAPPNCIAVHTHICTHTYTCTHACTYTHMHAHSFSLRPTALFWSLIMKIIPKQQHCVLATGIYKTSL